MSATQPGIIRFAALLALLGSISAGCSSAGSSHVAASRASSDPQSSPSDGTTATSSESAPANGEAAAIEETVLGATTDSISDCGIDVEKISQAVGVKLSKAPLADEAGDAAILKKECIMNSGDTYTSSIPGVSSIWSVVIEVAKDTNATQERANVDGVADGAKPSVILWPALGSTAFAGIVRTPQRWILRAPVQRSGWFGTLRLEAANSFLRWIRSTWNLAT